MLAIRLQRIGRKNSPAFRVVVTEKTRGPKTGRHVELLGSYSPHTDTAALKADRIRHWIEHGAQVSPTVHNILVNEKIIEGKKINVLPQKSPVVAEKTEGEAPTTEASAEAKEGDAPAEDSTDATAEEKTEEEQKEAPTSPPEDKESTEEKEETKSSVEQNTEETKS